MAIYWENYPDRRGGSLPLINKAYYKAELDHVGRMRLYARKGTKGRWGYVSVRAGDALEALITELETQTIRKSFQDPARISHAHKARKP